MDVPTNEHTTTVAEAAAALGVTKSAIMGRIRRGTLPAEKVGGVWRIPCTAYTAADDVPTNGARTVGTNGTPRDTHTVHPEAEALRAKLEASEQAHEAIHRQLEASERDREAIRRELGASERQSESLRTDLDRSQDALADALSSVKAASPTQSWLGFGRLRGVIVTHTCMPQEVEIGEMAARGGAVELSP